MRAVALRKHKKQESNTIEPSTTQSTELAGLFQNERLSATIVNYGTEQEHTRSRKLETEQRSVKVILFRRNNFKIKREITVRTQDGMPSYCNIRQTYGSRHYPSPSLPPPCSSYGGKEKDGDGENINCHNDPHNHSQGQYPPPFVKRKSDAGRRISHLDYIKSSKKGPSDNTAPAKSFTHRKGRANEATAMCTQSQPQRDTLAVNADDKDEQKIAGHELSVVEAKAMANPTSNVQTIASVSESTSTVEAPLARTILHNNNKEKLNLAEEHSRQTAFQTLFANYMNLRLNEEQDPTSLGSLVSRLDPHMMFTRQYAHRLPSLSKVTHNGQYPQALLHELKNHHVFRGCSVGQTAPRFNLRGNSIKPFHELLLETRNEFSLGATKDEEAPQRVKVKQTLMIPKPIPCPADPSRIIPRSFQTFSMLQSQIDGSKQPREYGVRPSPNPHTTFWLPRSSSGACRQRPKLREKTEDHSSIVNLKIARRPTLPVFRAAEPSHSFIRTRANVDSLIVLCL